MPTDDKRREVARRLRGNAEDTLIPHRTGRHHGMGCHEAADRFWNMCDRIKEAGNYDIAFSTASVLADLIEPEPERTCRITKIGGDRILAGWWECSECGPVYPPCRDEIAKWALRKCPHCGAKVVDE